MNESIRAAILAELVAAHVPRYQQPWEFTRADFAAQANCNYEMASRTLEKLVRDGLLVSEHAIVNGRRTLVYWRPEDVPE